MILMCLLHRERTGEGQSIEIPMFENTAKMVLEEHMYLRTFEPPLGGTCDPRLIDPAAKPMATRDSWICITANTDKQVFVIFDAIGRPELKTDPRFSTLAARYQNTAEYFAIRSEGMKQKTTAEWLDIFDKHDVPAMPYQTMEQLIDDPHLKDVGFMNLIDHPSEGKVWNINSPNKLSGGARKDFLPTPRLGQQSLDILREAGYSESEIQQMISSEAVVDGSNEAAATSPPL
jgi:crotonobetainyl-CoA:carnitine CoA-transferase CaiB-like acyl-CoA transferase